MKVAVKPAVGRHERRDVEAAATEIGHEHTASREPGECGGDAAGDDVLLVAVDDLGAAQRGWQRRGNRIRALSTHVMAGEDPDLEPSDLFAAVLRTERDEPGLHAFRHVSRELERIPLGAADDALIWIERRRHEMNDQSPANSASAARASVAGQRWQ